MALDRPTFHESWHRVADVRPRLRSSVRVSRQHFRGQRWHVIEDPATGRFFRLDDAGYEIVGRLDGRCTIDRAWRLGMERLGDGALTQGEVIALLGQLAQSNLLHADVPGDVHAMFERQKERKAREVRGYLKSLLFLRVPLIDPDHILDRWSRPLGWLFSPVGLVLWLIILVVGAVHVLGHGRELASATQGVLSASNLPLLYLTYAVIKLLHELGHGIACKALSRRAGQSGEVHAMGIMLMVFVPIPYVDASSSWALRSRLHRIVVAAAGIIVELACAAIAAVVWSRTAEGSAAHAIAYNAMFVAGVSTVLFNGNPLLRYDGYYILSDLLGIPNLAQRSLDMLKMFVKRFAWGVRHPHNPANDAAEAWTLTVYGVASLAYRITVYVGITLFIASQQFLLGVALVVLGAIIWIVVPLTQLIQHLATHQELDRTRGRAIAITLAAAALLIAPAALVPVPDQVRATGVIEPRTFQVVHAEVDGFVRLVRASGSAATGQDATLAVLQNDRIARDVAVLSAELDRLRAVRALAFREDPARTPPLDRQIEAVTEQLARAQRDRAALVLRSEKTGEWIAPDGPQLVGSFLRRGTPIGMVADRASMDARGVLDQSTAALVLAEASKQVELRARGRPDHLVIGTIERVGAAGRERLPALSLGFAAGGDIATRPDDPEGTRTAEGVFEVWIALPPDHGYLPGQRVVARFTLAPKPVLTQAYRAVRQVLQERFLL
jgi:putative peptide zinc metalloprotease protein